MHAGAQFKQDARPQDASAVNPEEGELKTRHVLLVALLLFALAVVPMAVGCGGPDFAEEEVDDFIASIEKSDNIDTPETIEKGWDPGRLRHCLPADGVLRRSRRLHRVRRRPRTALAHKMGLKLQVVSTAWDGIIPGLLRIATTSSCRP